MSDELLDRMTKALREEGGKEPSPERSALVRARVLAQTKRRAQLRPQGIWQWAAVVCLGFFVSTAMAHVIKVQLPKVIEALRDEPKPKAASKRPRPVQPKAAPVAAPEPATEPQPEPTPEPEVALEPEPTVADAPEAPPPPPTPAPARKPTKAAPRRAPKPAPAPKPENSESALAATLPEDEPPTPSQSQEAPAKTKVSESAELALFRRAQALHLLRDPKAIEAWDAYLRVAGTSPLAPEARYNRALSLVRAKRFAEAKSALKPFADGKYGDYRREEARALLERLSK